MTTRTGVAESRARNTGRCKRTGIKLEENEKSQICEVKSYRDRSEMKVQC